MTNRSLFRELHPEMFKQIPSSKPVKAPPPPRTKRRQVERPQPTETPKRHRGKLNVAAIVDFLRNGDATVPEIAAATGINADAIRRRLYDGIDGVERRVEMALPEKGLPRPLYGLTKVGNDAKLP